MNLTIPIPDNLDQETQERLRKMLTSIAQPEWALLFKFYHSQIFEIHCKGDAEPDIRATVRK